MQNFRDFADAVLVVLCRAEGHARGVAVLLLRRRDMFGDGDVVLGHAEVGVANGERFPLVAADVGDLVLDSVEFDLMDALADSPAPETKLAGEGAAAIGLE